MDGNYQAEFKYNNLPKRAILILKELGINDFQSLLQNLKYIQKEINILTPSKSKDKLEDFLLFINELIQQNKVSLGYSNDQTLREDLDERFPMQFLSLPIIYFSKALSTKSIFRLYSKGIYFLEDLYKKSQKDYFLYQYWQKILETETVSFFLKNNEEKQIEPSRGVKKFLEFNDISDIYSLENKIFGYEDFRKYSIGNRNIYKEIKEILLNDVKVATDFQEYLDANFFWKIILLGRQISGPDRDILYLRYVEGKTLEEIGQIFGVTRERVRQIEERVISFIKPFFDLLLDFEIEKYPSFEKLIESRPLLYPEEKHLLHFLEDRKGSIISLFSLSSRISIIQTGNEGYVISFNTDKSIKFNEINNYVKKYKMKNLHTDFNNDEIEHLYYLLVTEDLIVRNDPKEYFIKEYIRSLLEKRFLIFNDKKRLYLNNSSVNRTILIENILRKYGPMHFTKIKEYLNLDYGIDIKERNIHGTLTRDGLFTNVGRGIYDTKKSNLSGKTITQMIIDFLDQSSSPQNLRDIEDYVLSRKRIKKSSVLGTILNNSSLFGRTREGLYGLRAWESIQYLQIREKGRRYPISAKEGFERLYRSGMLEGAFSLEEYLLNLAEICGEKTSQKRITIYTLLSKLEKEGLLIDLNLKGKTKKWMIRN